VRELLHDPARVQNAYGAIRRLGDEAAPLLPDILALLDDETAFAPPPDKNGHSVPARLQSVLSVLSSMKTAARPATGRLVQIGAARQDYACISIATTLHDIGAEERIVGSVLEPLLLDPDWRRGLSWNAGQSLAKLCPDEARRHVALLVPQLGTNESKVDQTVLYALYSLGPQAQEAVPAVVPLLQNGDPWVAEFAAHMLAESNTDSVDAALTLAQVVSHRSLPDNLRQAYANALARCADALATTGRPAQSAVLPLLKILREKEADSPLPGTPENSERSLREAIIKALGRIGGENEDLVPVLRSQLTSRSGGVRAAATDALGRVAGRSSEALADLVRRLRDEFPEVRAVAALAIGRVANNRSPAEQEDAAVPLTKILFDEYPYVRQAAAISLGKIGPPAKAALPALREVLAEKESNGVDARTQKPHWLDQYLDIGDFNGRSVQDSAATAIEQIEHAPQEE
jgi:HEAT repeat protein